MSKVCLTDIAKLDGMSEWKILKFSDCIKQINTGLNPRKNFSLGHGRNRYITAKNLTKFGVIDFENCDYIDDRAKQIIHRRSDIQKEDILLSSRAPVGQCHLIKEEPDDYEIGESIFSIRVNKSVVRPDYFCLYLSSDFFVQLAAKNVTGSIIQEIRIGDLMNIDVVVPPVDVQEKIANSIDMIDKKLILNNSICSDLESMAKLLYDYWFVQFDFPDENGRPYKSNGGKMVWNDELKREIPDGWGVKTINDILFVSNDRVTTRDIDDRVYVPIEMIPKNKMSFCDTADIDKACSGLCAFDKDAILLSNRRVYFHKVVISPFDGITRDTVIIMYPRNTNNLGYSYQVVNSNHYIEYATKNSYGTEQTVLATATALEYKFPCPLNGLDLQYSKEISAMIEKVLEIQRENQELASFRDFLLPMLMNGQIKIDSNRC